MKKMGVVLAAFITLNCSRKMYSSEVKSNMEIFQNQLNLIIDYQEKHLLVKVEDYRYALFYLDFVTGISTKAAYSSTIGYQNLEDYKENIHDWQKWYKKNKYKLTDAFIDSAYKKVGLIYERPTSK